MKVGVTGGCGFIDTYVCDLPGVYICVGNHTMNNCYSISKTEGEHWTAPNGLRRTVRHANPGRQEGAQQQ